MLSPRPRKIAPKQASTLGTTTPVLLNTVYTRLRALAKGLRHACGESAVSGLHHWMTSYGARLDAMAELLQDEGAKHRAACVDSAAKMFLEETCAGPSKLLVEVQLIQRAMLDDYAHLSMRLDMDEELYALILEQERELHDVYDDIEDLRLEYDAYGEP